MGPAWHLTPDKIPELVRQCGVLVSHSDRCTDEQRGWARDVLDTATALIEERNQCLHRIWVVWPSAEGGFLLQSIRLIKGLDPSAEPISLDLVAGLLDRYARLAIRLSDLTFLPGDFRRNFCPQHHRVGRRARLVRIDPYEGFTLHSQRQG